MKRRRIIQIGLLLLLSLIIGKLLTIPKTIPVTSAATITYTKDGFNPKRVLVINGGTITFINKSGKAFWPASNLHPYHEAYREFDPGKPIEDGESWSFSFQRMGTWQYHDHIAPYKRGVIEIVDPVTHKNPLDCSDPANLDAGEKQRCWDVLLTDALDTRGIDGAFNVFTRLYREDEVFAQSGCHQHAHRVGELVYAQYAATKNYKKINFPHSTVTCGYGFFHGFIEHMMRDNPDVVLGKEFCEYLTDKYSNTLPIIRRNCYHSMGHGFIPDPPQVDLWGNLQPIIEKPLAMCRNISSEKTLIAECEQGVFNVVSSWFSHSAYGFALDEKDPFSMCRAQNSYDQVHSCYYEMAMVIGPFVNDDIELLARKYVDSIEDDKIALMVLNSATAGFMQAAIVQNNHEFMLAKCYKLASRLVVECINGLSGGFIAHGEPGKEYVKAIQFCSSPLLKEDHRDVCYKNIIRTFKDTYSKEKVADICHTVAEPYRTYCNYEEKES